jgi:hypothetical protein
MFNNTVSPKYRKSTVESDSDSDDDEIYDDDLPMTKSNTSTLFGGNGIKSFENNNSYYPDCFFVLSELSEVQKPDRYKLMYDFGADSTLNSTQKISIRKSLKNDSNGNKLILLLMDTIGFQPPHLLISKRKLFQTLFPSQQVLTSFENVINKSVYRHVFTTGEIRAILTGMILTRPMNHKNFCKWRSYFETLSSINLSLNEAFVCIATVLIELFLYNNVEVRPSKTTGGVGLFSNVNYRYAATKSPEDGQRICCGLSLPTKCLSTYNDVYLKKVEKTQHLISNRPGMRGNQVRRFWKYAPNKNNRGIFGVVYCCNSSKSSLLKKTKDVCPNVNCIAFGSVYVNMVEEIEGVYINKKTKKRRTVELCYLTSSTEILKNDELVWFYDWERMRKKTDGSFLTLTKLQQMEVPGFSK